MAAARHRQTSGGCTMMKSRFLPAIAVTALSLGLLSAPAFADDMGKGAMSKDKMEKSSMSKSNQMSSDHMKKDGMKKDGMGMKKDNMSSGMTK
jgi:pentapeptide MXKDX repeat protein